MTDPVSVPFWLFLMLTALALWSVLVLLLAPGMRWFLRRRINRMIEQVGTRFNIELPSFKLTRRQVLIDRVFHDERVRAAALEEAHRSGTPVAEVLRRVDRYAREIVPSFNAYVYFRVGYTLARGLARLLYRVRIGFADEAALRGIAPHSTLVFVINHRSNMDYILVSFLAAERVALSYAVGEWARVWGLQQLVRSMGAFFVRRNSGDPLYRIVLQRYVQMATEAGVTQAVFPEGGLTTDGALREPRFGLLDYMLKGFDERVPTLTSPQQAASSGGPRDLVFLPVGLNYDRVLEDRTQLLKESLKTRPQARKPGRWQATTTLLRFLADQTRLALTGRWHRFGYACVNFGAPVSMRAWCREHHVHFPALDEPARKVAVTEVARHLMARIGEVIPALPVSLVAAVFMTDPKRAWTELELKSAMLERINHLQASGAHPYLPRQDQDYAFGVGLRMLVSRRAVLESEGLFRADPSSLDLLGYYGNAIGHLGAEA